MGFLNRLFRREPVLEPADLSVLKSDIHSHLIPAIDDGSKDMEDSISMIRRLKELGFSKITTTPHVMSDFYKNTPEIILGGLKSVQTELKNNHINIEMSAAAEYYLDETLDAKIQNKELLTIGDNYVLFELPFMSEPPNLASIIFELQTNGYKPILAHPERYGYWYNDFDKYQDLKDKGVYLQLNILSLMGHYSPETKKIAERLVDSNLISFLGSDCHNHGHLNLVEIARTKMHLHKLLDSGLLLNHTI